MSTLCKFVFIFIVPSLVQAGPLNIDQLKQIIEKNQVTEIEKLLPLLPPEYLQNYALLRNHGMGATQEASLEFPKVLLFGEKAQFMMTFNGHPSQVGYTNLEIMQVNEAQSEFELFEIQFSDQKVSYSEKNPARCVACHDSPAKPLWFSPYPWKNSFGAEKDILLPEELAVVKTFGNHPRYRHLHKDSELASWPYRTNKDAQYMTELYAPNLRFGFLANLWFIKFWGKKFVNSPEFQENPDLSLAILLECWRDNSGFANPAVEPKLVDYLFQQLKARLPEDENSHFYEKIREAREKRYFVIEWLKWAYFFRQTPRCLHHTLCDDSVNEWTHIGNPRSTVPGGEYALTGVGRLEDWFVAAVLPNLQNPFYQQVYSDVQIPFSVMAGRGSNFDKLVLDPVYNSILPMVRVSPLMNYNLAGQKMCPVVLKNLGF